MAEFLSDEWFVKVDELTKAAGDLQIPKAMADVTVNLKVETAKGEVQMCMNRGIIQKGSISDADVNMSMPAEYAYKILVQNDWSVGMRGYIKRKIKLSGNMKKMIPLQVYKPSQPCIELTKKITVITDFKDFKDFKP
jgi:hypothetical protein